MQFYIPFVICMLFFLTACGNDQPQAGVVARVNGVPIFLKDVESGYDTYFFEWSGDLPPSLQEIKSTYGRVLLDLILIELIRAELDARNIVVTSHEILAVENEIRNDYPEGEFEKMLIEEYIDLEYWRSRIGHKLLWEKFVDRILMPGINVELDEINDYYYSNIEDFYIPTRLTYLYLSSEDRESLEGALHELENHDDIDSPGEKITDVVISRHEMRVDQLPGNLAEELQLLEQGQAGEIREEERQGFYALYLVGKKEEQLLKPHQAYNLIEKNIAGDKLVEAFKKWLSSALDQAQIEINNVLLDNLTSGSRVTPQRTTVQIHIRSVDSFRSGFICFLSGYVPVKPHKLS